MRKTRITLLPLLVLICALAFPMAALAEEQVYYLGSTVNAGADTGYANSDALTEKDAHYGWSLGRFYATGFTTVQREDGQATFLKTTGDDIKLKFRLDQDIDCLNGNSALTINDDANGYDQRFGSTLGELEARFGDQKYVFDIDENGKTACHAVDDFDDTFDKVTKVALVGTGVILISVTIVCVTGGAPVTALVACTGQTAGAITANQAHIALMAASTAIAIFDNGDVGEAAKDVAFGTGSDFIMQAIGGATIA